MKWWNSAFNAQCSRLIILVVQLGAVKYMQQQWRYSGKMKDRMKLSLLPKLMVFWVSHPLNANVLFCKFFSNLTLCMTKLRVLVLCLSYFTDIPSIYIQNFLFGTLFGYCQSHQKQNEFHSSFGKQSRMYIWPSHHGE